MVEQTGRPLADFDRIEQTTGREDFCKNCAHNIRYLPWHKIDIALGR